MNSPSIFRTTLSPLVDKPTEITPSKVASPLAKDHDNYPFVGVENDLTCVTDVRSLDPVVRHALPNRTPNVMFIWPTLFSLLFHLLSQTLMNCLSTNLPRLLKIAPNYYNLKNFPNCEAKRELEKLYERVARGMRK